LFLSCLYRQTSVPRSTAHQLDCHHHDGADSVDWACRLVFIQLQRIHLLLNFLSFFSVGVICSQIFPNWLLLVLLIITLTLTSIRTCQKV
jgi:hypothetical protein